MIRLEHADLEFPGYFASVSAEVTGKPGERLRQRLTSPAFAATGKMEEVALGHAGRTEAVTDIHEQERERYERAAASLRANLAGFIDRGFIDALVPPTLLFYQVAGRRPAEVRESEEADRRQWIGEVKERLGIVTMTDGQP